MTPTVQSRAKSDSALACWFMPTRYISGPGDDEERDAILSDLCDFKQFATDGVLVLLGAEKGRAMLRPHDEYPDSLVMVVYLPHGSDRLVSFWMNRDSLRGLLSQLLAPRGEAVDFDDLLTHEHVIVP